MRRILSAVCCFFFLLAALSCEEKMQFIEVEENQSLLSSTARESFESDFTAFDFNKFQIKPQWEKAIKFQGNIVEVPFNYKGKSFKPRLKDNPTGREEGIARLILSKKGKEVVAEVMYYFPSAHFTGKINELNLRNYKKLKFSGMFMFQQLGEEDMHMRFVVNGDIVKKRLGVKVPEAKNGRTMACQLWGVYLDHYGENGQLIGSDLLYTFNVCDGNSPIDEEQVPPEPGGNTEPVFDADGQQLLLDVQNNVFGWVTGVPELSFLVSDLNNCNVYGILSQPLGPVHLQSSYNLSSSVLGVCYYGQWTPTANFITSISPACTNCYTQAIQTFHQGNINVDIEGVVSAAGQFGGTFKINQSYGGPLGWYRN